MPTFVRKNIVVCSVIFTAQDGSPTQPSAANLLLSYVNQQGSRQSANVAMSYNPAANTWVAEWDSSAAGSGLVDWMVYGYGQMQAADQGCFDIVANQANTV